MRMPGGFHVYRNDVGTRSDKILQLAQGLLNHQMHIFKERGLEARNHGSTHRQHGTEGAVHDVEMQERHACGFEQLQLLTE